MGETLCGWFGIEIDKFPQIVENKKIASVHHFMSSYLKKKPSDSAYRGLDYIEDIFKGLNEYLVYVCEILMNAGRQNEAKGIYLRHNLQIKDFNKTFSGAK